MANSWQGIVKGVKPFVPVAIKRPLRRAVPTRYHGYFDPDWHRRTIGDLDWDYLGRIQLDYLVERGLRPDHYLLDVGCGPLRAGTHFIDYLAPGHYAGVDKRGDVLEVSQVLELQRAGLTDKGPVLLANDLFEFGRLDMTFDFAIAQSVFTHLPLNSIMRCLVEMGRVLRAGGRFYATIYENPNGKLHVADIQQSATAVSHYDRDYYHYDLDTLRAACAQTGLELEYEGEWGHPNNQKMIVFVKHAADG